MQHAAKGFATRPGRKVWSAVAAAVGAFGVAGAARSANQLDIQVSPQNEFNGTEERSSAQETAVSNAGGKVDGPDEVGEPAIVGEHSDSGTASLAEGESDQHAQQLLGDHLHQRTEESRADPIKELAAHEAVTTETADFALIGAQAAQKLHSAGSHFAELPDESLRVHDDSFAGQSNASRQRLSEVQSTPQLNRNYSSSRAASRRYSDPSVAIQQRFHFGKWLRQSVQHGLSLVSDTAAKKLQDLREFRRAFTRTRQDVGSATQRSVKRQPYVEHDRGRSRRRHSSSTESVGPTRHGRLRDDSGAAYSGRGTWASASQATGDRYRTGSDDDLVGYVPETVGYYTGPNTSQFGGPPQYQRKTLMAPLKERTVMEDHTETTGEAGLTSIISTDMSRPTTMEDSAMMGPPPTSQFTPLAKARNDRSHLRLATDPTKHHIPVKSYPIYPMSRNAVSSIERSTARTNCVRRDPAAETTVSEHDVLVESSPVSPTLRDSGSELGSDDRGLDKVIPQLDGDRGSVQEALAEDDEPIPPAYTRACAEHDIQSTLNLLADNEHALSKMEVPTSRARLDAQTPVDADDETPQVTASPAKGATAFPFPRQLMSRLSMPFIAKQRQPSALLKYCERNATTRQRRLMTDSLRTPDRFISSRPRTPTKDNMVFAQTAAMPSPLAGYGGQRIVEADPFAPPPRRSICMAEQHATLRGPPVRTREVGRAASRVDAPSAAEQRAVSEGGIWHVGGSIVAEGITSTPNGRGGRVTSGTCAPHYTADFLRKTSATEEEVKHGRRLALAMDIDQGAKMLDHSSPSSTSPGSSSSPQSVGGRVWRDSAWEREGSLSPTKASEKKAKDIPVIPFRVLNAPALRDDYYCSLLAYSPTLSCLAVGLGPHVYLWSEAKGTSRANIPDSLTAPFASHVTSIFFSSAEGGSAILAIGRADGKITLWSPLDKEPRFDSEQPSPVSCVCFRPSIVRRPSVREPSMPVTTEELLVGDEEGHVYFYAIEWPTQDQRDLFAWHGSMTLLARIACHTQQVCGLAWSPDGDFFATGGNDNQLFLFETKKILKPAARSRGDSDATVNVRSGDDNSSDIPVTGQGEVLSITPGQERHVFALNAAVKAIAFAPWQPSLIAAGGGSNDRCIHFFHTFSGAALATIDCHAQVTSLIWSEQRREIAATFGFAQPEHSYRVAVFTWPRCRMVVGIPWYSEERALYAVAYPKGPLGGVEGRQSGDAGRVDSEGRPWYGKRTREEGCLVVATSDASIKFHEIWPEKAEGKKSAVGWLGGSQILEGECSFEMERSSAIR
ncbi:hypothetical protein B0A50_00995 [Salinomyces thailandicus]|uniref:Uncharacterized protein n=1 Tax=Salinomyces thailandicus TaxID=706561 RepID=A0A4U0UBG2_9PEZI|nr:hypothetical protein B0A50_00995 [Salinomyces thailandica]